MLLCGRNYSILTDLDTDQGRKDRLFYGLLNARVGYEQGHFGLVLFAENLTDAKYFSAKVPPLNAGATGRPRTFGVMGTARF